MSEHFCTSMAHALTSLTAEHAAKVAGDISLPGSHVKDSKSGTDSWKFSDGSSLRITGGVVEEVLS